MEATPVNDSQKVAPRRKLVVKCIFHGGELVNSLSNGQILTPCGILSEDR